MIGIHFFSLPKLGFAGVVAQSAQRAVGVMVGFG
jgi:hypothetical protein